MARMVPNAFRTFSLRSFLAAVTVIATVAAYIVNDRHWQAKHDAIVLQLHDSNTTLEKAKSIWHPKYVQTYLTVIPPDGRSSYLSLHSLNEEKSPMIGGSVLEADNFGSVCCRYLRTVDERDLYEIVIGPGIMRTNHRETGKTPGFTVRYVSYEGEPMVVMDEGGYRVLIEHSELDPPSPSDIAN